MAALQSFVASVIILRVGIIECQPGNELGEESCLVPHAYRLKRCAAGIRGMRFGMCSV